MSDFFTRLTLYLAEIFSNIPSQLRTFRYLILFIFIVLTAFFAAGLPKFQLDSSIETWLHKEDTSVKALENFKKQFVKKWKSGINFRKRFCCKNPCRKRCNN